MPYRYVVEKTDYTDFARGRVFYNLPGYPAFPIRFSSEIFQRCLAVRTARGSTGPVTLYDPCCGSAYHLSTLAYLHWESIKQIIASDVDPIVLGTARRNLSLITLEGLEKRQKELAEYHKAYGKHAHLDALASANRLYSQLQDNIHQYLIPGRVFLADATSRAAVEDGLDGQQVDIVFTDVPHGRLSTWETTSENPLDALLTALLPVLGENAVVAVAGEKPLKIQHLSYQQIKRIKIGKRQAVLLMITERV